MLTKSGKRPSRSLERKRVTLTDTGGTGVLVNNEPVSGTLGEVSVDGQILASGGMIEIAGVTATFMINIAGISGLGE